MKQVALIFFILLTSALLFAADGEGAEHAEGIPRVVLYQTINFLLFVGILYYFLRKLVRDHFKGRHESFHAALTKAQAARKDAEARRQEIQERLDRLEASAAENLQAARKEAEALRTKILAEAQELSQHVRTEAQKTAEHEIQRAKTELREELLSSAVQNAKKILSENTSEADQKRLQSEFVEKIQAVR